MPAAAATQFDDTCPQPPSLDDSFQRWAACGEGIASSGEDIDKQASLVGDLFTQCFGKGAPQVSEPNAEPNKASESDMTEQELLFRKALKESNFDMRAKVGQWWAKALKDTPTLRAEYQQVGRSYRAQREFRQRWVASELKTIEESKTHTKDCTLEDSENAVYQPFTVIFKKEGSDAAALQAARVYVTRCCVRPEGNRNGEKVLRTRRGCSEVFRGSLQKNQHG